MACVHALANNKSQEHKSPILKWLDWDKEQSRKYFIPFTEVILQGGVLHLKLIIPYLNATSYADTEI